MTDEFFVYLFSSLNKIEYPKNSPWGFTNIISPKLNLDDSYEVGLANISFNNRLALIKKYDNDYRIIINIKDKKKSDIQPKVVVYIPQKNLEGETIHELIQNFNTDLVNYLISQDVIVIEDNMNHPIIFSYKENTPYVKFNNLKLKNQEKYKQISILWRFTQEMKHILGLQLNWFHNTPVFVKPPSFPDRSNLLLVSTDIVTPSYFAGQLVHFLDVIPLNHMFTKTLKSTLYKRVSKTQIQDISIKITDEKGVAVKFNEDEEIFVVLHFRRI